jgi:hypothetical protein
MLLAAAMCLAFADGQIKTNPSDSFGLLTVLPAATTNGRGIVPLWNPNSDTNIIIGDHALTKRPGSFLGGLRFPPEFDGKRLPPAFTPPGVYRAAPYTCLIMIVGPQPDDKAVRRAEMNGVEKMPTIDPKVRLIPYDPGER